MGVLSDALTAYRSDLVTAGLKNVAENQDIEDLPATNIHQRFELRLGATPFNPVGSNHGGATVDYVCALELEIHWDPQVDREALHNTIADDCTTANGVMLKAGNRASGVKVVRQTGAGVLERFRSNDVRAIISYEIEIRETQDVT